MRAGGCAPLSTISVDADGVDEDVRITDGSFLDGLTKLTVSFWLKPDAQVTDVVMGRGPAATDRQIRLLTVNNGSFRFSVGDTATTYARVDDTFTAATWQHFVGVYDGAQAGNARLVLYNDNSAAGNSHTGTAPAALRTSSGILTLVSNFESGSVYAGRVDSISFFNAALSAGEVSELYNSGAPGDVCQHSRSSTLLGYWMMGEGDTHPTIRDNSGNFRHATMTNMAAGNFVADAP